MNSCRWTAIAAGVLAATLAACDNNSSSPTLLTDADITTDVAASAGNAMALAVSNMTANEASANLSTAGAPSGSNVADNSITYSRSRKCYDVNGDPVVGCSPLSSVITIVTLSQLDGSRAWANDSATKTWTGAVHRASNDSLTRVFVSGTETQRVHNDAMMVHDTTTFTGESRTRFFSEGAMDSVQAVTFDLPRSTNPWPVSGSIVRTDTVHVVLTKGSTTETKDVQRRVQVTFPADAQGNVTLTINAKVCNLNLVTRRVTSCT